MRDWVFARQRYWGEPVPVVHTEDGKIYTLSDEELPLILPDLEDYQGHGGKAPLENAEDWVNNFPCHLPLLSFIHFASYIVQKKFKYIF